MKRPLATWSVVVLSLAATSCLTPMPMTQVKTQWKDPQFTPGQFQNALIVGVFPNLERRKLFEEEEFAGRLRKHGKKTIASYKLLPDIAVVDRPKIEALVKDQQIDLVFVTRLVDAKTIQTEVSGDTREVPPDLLDGTINYVRSGSKEVSTPGYTVDQNVVVLETKVFDTHTGACVWSCRSDTLINGYLDDLIKGFAKVMAETLYAPR